MPTLSPYDAPTVGYGSPGFSLNPGYVGQQMPTLYSTDMVGAHPQVRDRYGNPIGVSSPYSTSASIQNLVNGFNAPAGGYGVGSGAMTIGPRNVSPPGYAPSNIGYAQPANSYVPSMGNNGAGRPVGSLVTSPRSAAVSTGVTDAYKQNNATNQTAQQSLADWTKQYIAGTPQANANTSQETGAVSRFYDGTAASDLAGIRNNRATAIRDLTEAAYRRAGRANSIRRLGSGNANSSYLDRQYAQDLGGIASQAAVQNADQARADRMYLDQQQMGQLGSRQVLLNQQLQRNLMPAQVSSGLQMDATGRLGSVAALDYGNNAYQPAEDAYSRRIRFLQDLQNQGLYS